MLPFALLCLLVAYDDHSAKLESTVLVELFTSQGCSSCPPADRLLSSFRGDSQFAGRVVALAFHVDYWNYIGWRDPFSSAHWSERQRRYSGRISPGQIYTPQLVVNGSAQAVGNQARDVRRLIEDGLSGPAIAALSLRSRRSGSRIVVDIDGWSSGAVGAKTLDLFVAIVENDLVTRVGRGENAGRMLRNDGVVRRLERAVTVRPAQRFSARHQMEVDPAWQSAALEVVAFLQDPESLRIYAATRSSPS